MGYLDDDEIREYVREKTGDMGLSFCELIEKGITTIADLAETMSIPRRATRQVLYQMSRARIVGYKRFKEDRRIFFQWFITPKRIRRMISTIRQNEIRELEEQLEFEQDHKFFECQQCGERYLFTEAFEFEFTCEHCGASLEPHENEEAIKKLRAKLEELTEAEKLSKKYLDEDLEAEDPDIEHEIEVEIRSEDEDG